MQAQSSRVGSQSVPSKQEPSPKTGTEPRYYANPDLLDEKCKQLESIPFVLVEGEARSESSKKRIQKLEKEMRLTTKAKRWSNIELDSTILEGPLVGGWPEIELEDENDIEYPLAETEEEWFAWEKKVEEKRAQKLQMSARILRDAGVKGATKPSKAPEKPTTTKLTSITTTSHHIIGDYSEGKENEVHKPLNKVESESQWNNESLERAFQSTQVDQDPSLSFEFAATPQTPPTQLATPPDSRLQLRVDTAFPQFRTPSRSQGSRRGRADQETNTALLYPQNLGPKNKSDLQDTSLSPHTSPPSPTTPTRGTLAASAKVRRQVDGWRKRAALALPDSRHEDSPPRSLDQYSQDRVPFSSPTTTHFLYGTQDHQVSRSQPILDDAYARELQEELDREKSFFDMNKAVDANNGPHRVKRDSKDSWGGGSFEEETEFKSQEARAISSFVENDLGNPYRDEPYAALNPGYENPYDDY